jgi:ketosteroid isomerase-like protein
MTTTTRNNTELVRTFYNLHQAMARERQDSRALSTNTNIAVFRFQDGLISEYHDYFDPHRFQVVVDALPKS